MAAELLIAKITTSKHWFLVDIYIFIHKNTVWYLKAQFGSYFQSIFRRERKDFQSGRRDRISPNRRRSPYQRSHDSHGDFRRDSKKSHGRYEVKAPRLTFDIKELSTSSLKLRYPKMYIPSDFFHTHLRWQEVFPLYRTMKLGNHSEFQVRKNWINQWWIFWVT